MDHKIDKLISAIGDMNTAYLEEAIAFDGAKVGQQKAVRSKKLSAALVAALVILGLSVTAFAISRIPLSWRDIFSTSQTVIGDEDEEPVVSQQAAATEELQIKLEKVISDERTLYILYSVKATLDETPITIESEVLAENVPLAYGGETLQVKKVACSKLSMAVYFDSYVDSTADNWTLEIFDANGDLIPSWWGFIAAQTDDSCMFLTRFDEPIEPETIRKLTFNGETVFER